MERIIAAPPERLFALWTEPEELVEMVGAGRLHHAEARDGRAARRALAHHHAPAGRHRAHGERHLSRDRAAAAARVHLGLGRRCRHARPRDRGHCHVRADDRRHAHGAHAAGLRRHGQPRPPRARLGLELRVPRARGDAATTSSAAIGSASSVHLAARRGCGSETMHQIAHRLDRRAACVPGKGKSLHPRARRTRPPRGARCRGRRSRRTTCSKARAAASTLADLFRGKSQLIVYHFMFGPDWEAGCKSCSFWADNFERIVVHLNARDTNLVLSRARPTSGSPPTASAWAGPSSGSPRSAIRSTGTSRCRSRREASRDGNNYNFGTHPFRRRGSAGAQRVRQGERRASSTPTRPMRAASTCSTAAYHCSISCRRAATSRAWNSRWSGCAAATNTAKLTTGETKCQHWKSSARRNRTTSGSCAWCARKRACPTSTSPSGRTRPDVDAIHPFGKIPVMRHGDVDAVRVARRSRPISTACSTARR